MRIILILGFAGFLFSCGPGREASSDDTEMDYRTEVRLRQYMVQGKQLYLTHCANCHQKDGSGLAQLYPPLAKSDYLMSDLKRAACIVKNGIEGEIVVTGRTFNQPMPGLPDLTPIEVAEIVTYVSNSWGNEAGISSTRDVSIWLKKCEE
ncbi:MAG: cytochrome C [Rickettsiales bacterium]|nr:cytochrome C [Rickettsiales bacterium]